MGGDHSKPPPTQEGVQTFRVKRAGQLSTSAGVFTDDKQKLLFLKNEIAGFLTMGSLC